MFDKEEEKKTAENKSDNIKAIKEEERPTATLDMLRQSVSEEDDVPISSLTLKTILGGDILTSTIISRQAGVILLGVIFVIIYVAFRYQCQRDIITINKMETTLKDAKYKALSSSSTLTERCRESHVLEQLRDHI